MRSTKLYSILSKFTRIEQNRFRKYIQSPYFNRSLALVELFEYLAKEINGEVSSSMSKEEIWKHINPDLEYDDVRFRKYNSDLLKLVERYLAQQSYEKDPAYEASFLIEAIGEKKLEKLYTSAVKTAHRAASQTPYESSDAFYHRYRIQRNYYNLTEAETKRSDKSNVEDINKYLDLFYICEKLKFYIASLSRKRVASHDYNIQLVEDLLKYLDNHEYLEYPRIGLYYLACQLYLQPEQESYFTQLQALLNKFALSIPPEEAVNDIYGSAENYCVRKITEGNENYYKDLFAIYQEKIENGLAIADGHISPWVYRNTVTTGLRLEEFDWIESFIYDYKKNLPEAYRENAFTFSLAQLYFYQKKFSKVIELLREVEYDDFSYSLNSKTILLATYYEMDEIEPLYSLFESFRVYLNRNKLITDSRKVVYKNLIKFTKKLTNITPGDQSSLKKIKKEVEDTPNIVNKGWLIQKIEELEGV